MSDDERALSDDDGADLFESESEDQFCEVEASLDAPSLSMDSLYVRSPLATEDHDDEDPPFERTDCETDQSGAGGFDIGSRSSTPAAQPIQIEGNLEDHRDDSSTNVGNGEEINLFTGDEATEHDADREKNDASPSATIPHCDSLRMRAFDDRDTDEKQLEIETHEDDQSSVNAETLNNGNKISNVQYDEMTAKACSSTDKPSEISDSSLIPTATCAVETPPFTEPDELAPESSKVEAVIVESSPVTTQSGSNETTITNLSPRDTHEQQTDVITPLSVEKAAKAPVYTVESLFPIIYETGLSSPASRSESSKVVPASISSTNVQRPNRERRRHINGATTDRSITSRLTALQAQLDVAHSELANVARTHKLQLSMVETDNKKLSQRNARLKTQLSVATADLQRSNAEMAKLKTENELYAAKLPRLQAELLEETSQVDETQAQSVQTLLAFTQLKARSHVLQTRALSLEAQNNKQTQQLREYQQQLKRKTAGLMQQTEKASKIEADTNELKTIHAQEKLDWKHRMTSALQRFEHDKVNLEAQFSSKERKELREAKDRAEKAAKKRRAAEAAAAKLEEQLKHHKYELASANDCIQRNTSEVRTLESLLRRAHRTEATLRNDLVACKTKLCSLQDEEKRRMTRSAPVQTRRRRLEQQIPIELLLHLSDSSEEEDNQEQQPCSRCLASDNELQSPIVCSECPQLQDQLHRSQQDLRRVRSLHAAELAAQASLLDALLLPHKRQLAM